MRRARPLQVGLGVAVILAGALSALGGCSSSTGPEPATGHPKLGVMFASPSLGGEPYGVAIAPNGTVLVARVLADAVTRFDLPDTMPGTSVPAGTQAVHLALSPAGTIAYVVNQAGQAIHVIDVATGSVTDSAKLTNDGFNIAVSPDGQRVYVTTSDGRVYVMSTSSNDIIDSMRVGSAANGLAFSPDGSRLYISSRDAGTITVFSTQTDAPLDTIATGGAPQRLVVSHDGAKLFAANESAGINVINLPGGTLAPSITLDGSGYGVGLSPDGTQLYATNPGSGKVFIVNEADGHLISTLTVGGAPRNVAFAGDGRIAVVTDGNGRVLFFH